MCVLMCRLCSDWESHTLLQAGGMYLELANRAVFGRTMRIEFELRELSVWNAQSSGSVGLDECPASAGLG